MVVKPLQRAVQSIEEQGNASCQGDFQVTTVRWHASAGGGGGELFVQGRRNHSLDEIAPFSYVRSRGPPLGHHRGEGGAPALDVGLYQMIARRAV